MFSPQEDEVVEHWFQRLNAPLKRLPIQDRTEINQEVRQHLEALAAANEELGSSPEEAWELALTQFGDPYAFGKKMSGEWQQGRTGFRADMKAILFGFCLQWGLDLAIRLSVNRWFNRFYNPSDSLYTHGQGLIGIALVLSVFIAWGLPLSMGIIIGRKFPFQAIKSAFYAETIDSCQMLIFWMIYLHNYPSIHFTPGLSWLAAMAFLQWLLMSAVAYLASVTKRGWYRPSLADFKITLPRRRFKIAR